MPLLGGIFGKKNKTSVRSINNGSSPSTKSVAASDIDSTLSSPTTSYVTADKSLPSSPNGKGLLHADSAGHNTSSIYPSIANGRPHASSSKLRLPFSRKKSKVPISDSATSFSASPSTNVMTPPRPSYAERLSTTSAASDSDTSDLRRLRPPPSKSAIFAAYTDPSSALSTRSLPNESSQSWTSMQAPQDSPVPPKEKRPSLFSWTKSSASTKSTSESRLPMKLDSPPRPEAESSFNLKSFRHVRPPSPNASNSSLVLPPARPRGASINSNSSQRISVAAFREVQARRSTAGSPVPSFRSPSPSLPPPAFPQDGQRGRASPRSTPATRSSPHLPHRDQRRRSASTAFGYTSESDESTTSSEEESDDEAEGGRGRGVHRNSTITQRSRPLIGRRQAKSEAGHGSSYESSTTRRQTPSFLTTRSQNGHGQTGSDARQSSYVGNALNSPVEPPPRSQSSMGTYGTRQRASASTSAVSPSAAAKRASILANANAGLNQDPLAGIKQTTRHVRDSSTYSNPSELAKKPAHADTSESDSDEDNAPLASLVPPRRPGSAMSAASSSSIRANGARGPPPRAMSKPLIDINELTSKKPGVGPYKKADDGFTRGGLLAGQSANLKPTLVESPKSIGSPSLASVSSGLTSRSPPPVTQFAPPTSPSQEVQGYFSLEGKLANALTPVSPQSQQRTEKEKEKESEREREKDAGSEKKRDMLTERLAKLAKGKGKEKESVDGGVGAGMKETKPLSPPPPSQHSSAQPESPKRLLGSPRPILSNSKPSPPDEDLIQDVDDSILRLISQMGESQEMEERTSESEDAYGEPERAQETAKTEVPRQPSPEEEKEKEKGKEKGKEKEKEKEGEKEKDRIAPIPIKQRAPPPSFSVMSRPPIQKPQDDSSESRLNSKPSANPRFNASSGRSMTVDNIPSAPEPGPATRPRSTTLMPSSTFGLSTSSFSKLNVKGGGSSGASSGGYSNSNASSTNVSTPTTNTNSPQLNSANADRANALKTVASAGSGVSRDSDAASRAAASASTNPNARQRSSTLLPTMPSQSREKIAAPAPVMPVKPFAVRRDSPASSTGDSSSVRAPLTPRDGSDIGGPSSRKTEGGKREEWSSGVSGLGTGATSRGAGGAVAGRHVKRRSVSFDEDVKDVSLNGRKSKESVDSDDPEARRRERRRSEARAAIELGNVINGPGPIVSDDEDEDLPISQAMNARISAVNPMMAMGNPMQVPMQVPFGGTPGAPSWGGNMPAWPQQGGPQMLAPPQFMISPPTDNGFLAAHQQAMMIAKQAYQMAIARQAMAAAADEWDRNSVMGGSVYGGPASNASVIMGAPPFGMMGMGGMGNGWSTGSVIFPNSSQSVYSGRGGGISSSRSEYGGGGASGGVGGGNWSSAKSSYGEAFGPSDRLRPGMGSGGGNRNSGMVRDSVLYPPMPPMPQSQGGSSSAAAAKGRGRTTSGPATSSRGAVRKAPPPSSWKAGV